MTAKTWCIEAVACVLLILPVSNISAQTAPPVVFPPGATSLEGSPASRVDTTSDSTTRRQLDAREAAEHRLRIQIKNGQFFWSNRDDRRLTITSAGEFTYLTSNEPGQYVRIRRLNDRLTYVEHVDTPLGSVTYWGELRVVVGR